MSPTRTKSAQNLIDSLIPNVFSVDVEDYFQVSAFEHRVTRANWDKYESRVEASTDRLLALLDRHSTLGTFFILGWVAERFPSLVKRIYGAGHEVASHGYWHKLVYNQTPEEFGADLVASRDAIGTACGVNVTAYRAPSFSICSNSLWALDVLIQHHFTVDSSIFPIAGHDRYGIADAPVQIHKIERTVGTITEFPLSRWQLGRLNFPIGGGYFRILPMSLTLTSISQIHRSGLPVMFYIHPWEVDPMQPRIAGAGWKSKFRHYTGLTSTLDRLEKLLTRMRFSTMTSVIDDVLKKDKQG